MDCRRRVNGSMLRGYIGKFVCLVGKVTEISPNGAAVTVQTSDGETVKVSMMEPLSEEIQGVVEVVAQVNSESSITGHTLVSYGVDFDLELYNDALIMMSDYPHFFGPDQENTMEY